MTRILTVLSLAVAVILFPPATLALISNSAVPGDATYPVKRKLEDGIVLIASLTPQSKAWFAVERSSRRFKEAAVLLTKNEQASTILTELVDQTSTAAQEITQISDPVKKQQLIEQLSKAITNYNEGLSVAANLPAQSVVTQEPTLPIPSPTPTPTVTPTLTPTATPVPAFSKPTQPTPTPTVIPTPIPAPVPAPTPQPALIPPVPQPIASSDGKKEQVDQTKKELEKIKKRLEKEKEKLKEHQQKFEERQERKEENKLTPQKDDDKIKKEKR